MAHNVTLIRGDGTGPELVAAAKRVLEATGVQFNWATQAVNFVLLDIRWGAAGYFQNLYQAATIYINVPLAALVYWLTRRRKRSAKAGAG